MQALTIHVSIGSTQHGRHSCQLFVVHSMTGYLNYLLNSYEPADQNHNASSKCNVTATVFRHWALSIRVTNTFKRTL